MRFFRLYRKVIYKYLWMCAFALVMLAFYKIEEQISVVNLPKSEGEVLIYGNQVRDDLRKTYATAIQQAEKSVLLIIFTLRDPQIVQALRIKAEEGVKVHIICDARISHKTLHKLGPKVSVIKVTGQSLMHQKIMVIDDAQVWVGSTNMTTDSLRMFGNLVVSVNSPAMAQMMWQKADQFLEAVHQPILEQKFLVGTQRIEFWFLPDNPNAQRRLIQLMNNAQKSIRIAMYTWTRLDLAYTVLNAFKRGVNVEVVIDAKAGRGAGGQIVSLLKQNQLPISLSLPGPMLHHKFAYIDRTILVNGSANWTRSAFEVNDDCFMVIHDLTETQQMKLDELWNVIRLDAEAA